MIHNMSQEGYFVNPKQAGFLQIGMTGEGQILPPPFCNFCLNGPILFSISNLACRLYLEKFLDIEKKKLKKLPGSCSKC